MDNPQPGDVILANGPHPVGYRKQTGYSRLIPSINRDAYRKDYLLYLANFSPANASRMLPQEAEERIAWKGEASYRIASKAILQKIRAAVAELKKQLVAHQVLSASEAEQTNPSLDIQVADTRERQVPPLPEVRWTLIPE